MQVVEEVAPEAAAEKPEEVTAVAAEPEASAEASDPPAEAVAAVKISEEAAAAEGEGREDLHPLGQVRQNGE